MIVIHDAIALYATRILPFGTRPHAAMRVVRYDGSIIACDARGRIFASGVRHNAGMLFGNLQSHAQERVIQGLHRLGMVTSKVLKHRLALCKAEEHRDTASYLLTGAKELKMLGAPFTAKQIRRLRAIAREP